ncbi:MAG: hypothetical protein LWX83_01670, partial [Anaerolineae bacterium]|nr:hypothetical protein [Anaerolineae bacterium]
HALLEKFVIRLGVRKNETGGSDWHIYANPHEPLCPADEEALLLAGRLINRALAVDYLPDLQSWASSLSGCFDTHGFEGVVDLIRTLPPPGCFDIHDFEPGGCFDIHALAQAGCFDTLLKILIYFKDTITQNIPEEKPKTPPRRNLSAAYTDTSGGWNDSALGSLIKSPVKRAQILSSKRVSLFLAYLINAAADDSVEKPLNYAVDQAADEKSDPPAPACLRLAALSPPVLFKLIEDSLAYGAVFGHTDWQDLFAERLQRVRLLGETFGLRVDE